MCPQRLTPFSFSLSPRGASSSPSASAALAAAVAARSPASTALAAFAPRPAEFSSVDLGAATLFSLAVADATQWNRPHRQRRRGVLNRRGPGPCCRSGRTNKGGGQRAPRQSAPLPPLLLKKKKKKKRTTATMPTLPPLSPSRSPCFFPFPSPCLPPEPSAAQ